MSIVTVTYILSEEEPIILGKEIYEDINQYIIPDYIKGHTITISKFFEGQFNHKWKIIDLKIPSVNDVNIYLNKRETIQPEEYLLKTYRDNNRVIRNLQLGTLVEVDYGYTPLIRKINGDIKSSKRYPDYKQKNEMHKRRLAIVVKASNSLVQIIPISSQPQDLDDLSIFQLDKTSLHGLVDYSNGANGSSVICSMVESVSFSRILPPRTRDARTRSPVRNITYKNKITNDDRKALTLSLSHGVGLSNYETLLNKNKKYYSDNITLKKDLDEAKEINLKVNEVELELDEVKHRNKMLLEILHDLKQQYHAGGRDAILQEIEEQAKEYSEHFKELEEA